MAPRSRSFSTTRAKGWADQSGQVIGNHQVTVSTHSCSDQTGPGDCAPLTINSWTFSGGVINKRTRSSSFDDRFFDYTADIVTNTGAFPTRDVTGNPTNVAAATQAVARTNPSRPYVDVPVALLELGDIVQLVRDSGRSLIRQAAGANIKYQFGIAPLADDIAKLMRFQEIVDGRVREIERLRGPTGLRRTVDIATNTNHGVTSNLACQSVYRLINRAFTWFSTEQVRAHVRWEPSISIEGLLGDAQVRALARRAVLGLTLDASTAWEAIPWSWLIDWGSNIGTYLKTQRNIVPAQLRGVHIMRHTKTHYWCTRYFDQNGSHPVEMTPIRVTRERKTRAPSFVSPVAHFPFLNGKQVGIVASLSVLRGRGR